MSKLENHLTEACAAELRRRGHKGKLIKEWLAVRGSKDGEAHRGQRLFDGVFVLDEPKDSKLGPKDDLRGRRVFVIQSKAKPLGMYLMGQVLFSMRILEKERSAKVVGSFAVCHEEDALMSRLLKEEDGRCEVLVVPQPEKISDSFERPVVDKTRRRRRG